MESDQLKKMMLNFVERNYPVTRIKHDMRFKRGIILDGGEVYLLSDAALFEALQRKLFVILTVVFSCDKKIIIDVLKSFLKLK